MRILAITNLYPNPLQPNRGTFNREQFRALGECHEVAVISPVSWVDELSARRQGSALLPQGRSVRCDGLRVEHPRYIFPPKVLRSRYGNFFQHSIRRVFRRVLSDLRPDIVFAAWAYPDGWAAIQLGHDAGLPVVVKVHGSDLLTLPQTPGRGPRTAEAMRQADAVIAVSQDLANRAVQMGADLGRVSVVYDGIDPQRFFPGSRDEARARVGLDVAEKVLLFVGNLVPVKGVDTLIEACSRLAGPMGLEFRCFLVGQGPLRDELQEQIDRAGLRGVVTLVGPLAHHELPDWFRAADVFVLPSHSEGIPCVLLEAAACRTSFVASRVGGIPEIAHLNDGRLVAPGNAAELAEAINHLLTSPRQDRPPYSRSHQEAAADLAAVFEKVLGAAGRSGKIDALPQPV